MRRPLIVAIAAATVMGAAAVTGASAGASGGPSVVPHARAARACGSFRSSRHTLGVTVARGHASCGEARSVLATFVGGHSTLHPAGAHSYWTVGSWRCMPLSNGGVCTRGATNPRTARDSIEARIK